MPIPYTPAAVQMIRHAAASGQGGAAVQRALGWDAGMLERVCRRHGVDFAGGAIMAAAVTPAPKPARKPARKPLSRTAAKSAPAQAPIVRRQPTLVPWSLRAAEFVRSITVTYSLSEQGAQAFNAAVAERCSTRSRLAGDILARAVADGTLADCAPGAERRRLKYSSAITPEVYAALVAAAGLGSLSALIAAIIDRHLGRAHGGAQ